MFVTIITICIAAYIALAVSKYINWIEFKRSKEQVKILLKRMQLYKEISLIKIRFAKTEKEIIEHDYVFRQICKDEKVLKETFNL